MSDAPEDVPVLPEDVLAFVGEKWAHPECPRCDQNKWAAPTHDIGVIVPPLGPENLKTPQEAAGMGLKIFWLWCENCGHIELITFESLQTWKRARAAT